MLDPIHYSIPLFDETSLAIWRDKYRWGAEKSPEESLERVSFGVYVNDASHREEALSFMKAGLWIPAGRIHAGAGTSKRVTQINCYVSRTIEDSMEGIADALKDAMLTMQQGGGIGMDFSTLRPSGAVLKRTGSIASGPLPFMDMWHAMCGTIMSAGSRRGAMMGILRCDHPDLPAFIKAKHEKGRLTNFNISVAVTDAFMKAVEEDSDWSLGFPIPPATKHPLGVKEKDGEPWYIYETLKARDLWNQIIRSTYEYSEPGVVFIDRINQWNNLYYCEEIRATNPCGEQPLPPNGACNLGAVNLARLVRNPFSEKAELDEELLVAAVRIGVRFLDNVIDTTLYPLEAQKIEEVQKRRIGLGVMGLANCLSMLGYRYGSTESLKVTASIMELIRNTAYDESVRLAEERGPFPLFNEDLYLKGAFIKTLPEHLREKIFRVGIRNGVLLTIAPTGTTSLYFGNVSSGLEPPFLLSTERKVLQADGSFYTLPVEDYSLKVFKERFGSSKGAEDKIETAQDLSVGKHLEIQAVCQRFVDSSISKTINCPEDYSFTEFQAVYTEAYRKGCKGCTTYRPSPVRGSVFTSQEESPKKRPEVLSGKTYKIKWPTIDAAFYITINSDENGRPFEVFISSRSAKYTEWTTALSRMITAIFRRGGNISFVAEELKQIVSSTDAGWVNGRYFGSLVAMIGDVIDRHLNGSSGKKQQKGDICPKCNSPTLIKREGCTSCTTCDYSTCS